MTDPIRAALEAAFWATHPNSAEAGDPPSRTELRQAAAAIAAFLRALSEACLLELLAADDNPNNGWRDTLAQAVLAVAKEKQK